ncbi:MAG: phosphate ABC transporter permease subunit PstC [Hyphomicrobium sp.]|nr:phosphate ABC transporter permease subunit PstC [Hyphomicrobium sp.]
MASWYALVAVGLFIAGYILAGSRARAVAGGDYAGMHSLPTYHGLYTASLAFLPALFIFICGSFIAGQLATYSAISALPENIQSDVLRQGAALREAINIVRGGSPAAASAEVQSAAESYGSVLSAGQWATLALGMLAGFGGLSWGLSRVSMNFRARNNFEKLVHGLLWICATIAVLTTVGIVFSVVGETYRFFFDPDIKGKPTVFEFLFGTDWNPQAAMRADQGDIQTAYGFLPLLTGTLLITTIAIVVAGPLGLFSAIYLAEYASPRMRAIAKPILEILAGIPTVVLGFFAALTVAPYIRGWGEAFGLEVASESALAAGVVMGMMIIPFISSLSDDVINAVPQSLRDGAYAMGATKSETIRQVILPAALPGIVSAFMLAISRAIGETMIVVMAAGLAANLTFNPLDAVTTITVQIKTILVGDQEFDSAKTLAAFALGFVLFFVTLVLNFIALKVVQRYREQYD